jgi:NAD(P)-dependent dehydrogenase (short-subunit alcohol dehydrogenase family)
VKLWEKMMAVHVEGIPQHRLYRRRTSRSESPYAVFKAGAIRVMKALSVELGSVVSGAKRINPTATETAKLATLNATEEANDGIEAAIPMGRIAQPENTPYAALYLASHGSSMAAGTAAPGCGRGTRHIGALEAPTGREGVV